MKIQFQLMGSNEKEIELMDEFCKSLVRQIKRDVINLLPKEKLMARERDMLNATWILWKDDKPKHINMIKLAKFIAKNIRYKKRRGHRYLIEINPAILMPHSKNSIEQIARFLDKGNEVSTGTFFLSRVFMKYRVSIDEYWNAFVSLKLKRLKVSKVVIIR